MVSENTTPLEQLEQDTAAVDTPETVAPEAAVPEAPSEAPPVETPPVEAPLVEAPPPVAPPPSITSAERQRLQQAEQRLADMEAERVRGALEAQTRQTQETLVNEGVPSDLADRMAQRERTLIDAALGARQQAQEETAFQAAKGRAIAHYTSGEFAGVPASELTQFNDQGPMEAHARLYKRLLNNERAVKEIKQDSVPAQSFDAGTPQSGGELDGEALEQAVGNGDVELTPEVIKRLTAFQKTQGFGG
jgi:hypothetical protein